MQNRKMQDWKMTDRSAGLENAGLENIGQKCKAVLHFHVTDILHQSINSD